MSLPLVAHLPASVAERLIRALAGIPTFIVGGTARDWAMRDKGWPARTRAFRDLDLVCAAPDAELERRFREAGFAPVPVGRQFEVIKVIEPGIEIDISPLAKGMDRRPAADEVAALLTKNLGERDLTINAMALSWPEGGLVDPIGGAADLDRRIVRAVGRADNRLGEDPLRALRVARFAAAFEFDVDAALPPAMAAVAPRLAAVAPERVRVELLALLAAPRPSIGLRLLAETGVLAVVLPELDACRGVAQNRRHRLDVFGHTLLVADLVSPTRPLVRLAALLHDVGKPETKAHRAEKDDVVFHDHDARGADLAESRLRALRFSNDETEAVLTLVREHMFRFTAEPTPRSVRRWMARLGDVPARDAIRLALADAQATSLAFGIDAETRDLLTLVRQTERARPPLRVAALALGGKDLIGLGLAPGPVFSEILDALLEWVLDDPARNERESLLAEARRRIGEAGTPTARSDRERR
jgi:tRNA nucleotidyltransferase (CCA-adding enzyme)